MDSTLNKRILYVDDEANILSSFASMMRSQDVETFTLHDSTQIDGVLHDNGPFAMVLSDQRMPVLDGVGVLKRVSAIFPDSIKILVTGYSDQKETARAVNEGGITRYVNKPWNQDEMRAIIADGIVRYNLTVENKRLLDILQERNATLQELLEGTIGGTVHLLGDILGYINPHVASQSDRLRQLGLAILKSMPELSSLERWEITRALDVFNLGIAVLPPWIQLSLQKNEQSGLERFQIARTHNILAATMLQRIPRFDNVARIVRLSSKNYDGTGDPADEKVAGDDLPLGSRLLHILIDLEKLSTENFKGRIVLQRMAQKPAFYDITLIARILGGDSRKQDARELMVSIDDLVPGMVLLADIVAPNGQALMRALTTISETSLHVLRQWHLREPIPEKVRVRIPSNDM